MSGDRIADAFMNCFPCADYADPTYNTERARPVMEKQSSISNLIGTGNYPIEQRIEDKKRGIGRQRYPFVGD